MIQAPNGHDCHLIAIEGPDRVGKATQARMLKDHLNKDKITATVEEVPYDDKITHPRIYEMLHDGTATDFPVVFQTLQGINRRIFQATFLPTLARYHDVIILDRWNMSSRVYGEASGVTKPTTDAILKGILEPDLTFVFDSNPYPKEGLDAWEADLAFQSRVRELYLRECEANPDNYVKIDAGHSREIVHDQVFKQVIERLR